MAELYTYAQAPVKGLVRGQGSDKRMAAAYVAGLPEVNAAVKIKAMIGAEVASEVLAFHSSGQRRSSRPRIELVKGDRTDWHINMVVDFDGDEPADAWVIGWAIEYGRNGYYDSLGRYQRAAQGVGALTAAMVAMGAGF